MTIKSNSPRDSRNPRDFNDPRNKPQERPERAERPERSEWASRRPERPEWSNRDRSERAPRPDWAARGEQRRPPRDRFENGDRPRPQRGSGLIAELRELDFRATRLETIGDDAFFGCLSVVSLSFPATLRAIGSSAFSGCVKIAHVDAPRESLDVDVKPYAFHGVRAPLQVVDGKLKLGAEKLRFQPSTSFR